MSLPVAGGRKRRIPAELDYAVVVKCGSGWAQTDALIDALHRAGRDVGGSGYWAGMSIDSTPPEFAAALVGRHTPLFSPPSITRQGFTNHDILVRLSMSRRPSSEQYESPLIGGDELHFSASGWSVPIYKEQIHLPMRGV